MRTIVVAISSLVLVLIAAVHVQGQSTNATEFWRRNLPRIPIPDALSTRSSQLQGAALSSYISQVRRGRLDSLPRFCSQARLLCYVDCLILRRIACRPVGSYNRPCVWPCDLANRKLIDDPQTFFSVQNLVIGGTVDVRDTDDNKPPRDILPKSLADAFPSLNTSQFDRFVNLFNASGTLLSSVISSTLSMCDNVQDSGTCVSSLEGLVTLALPYQRLYYVAQGAGPLLNATIIDLREVAIAGQGILVCHALVFPYQVFFCHDFSAREVKVFSVSVDDGAGNVVNDLLAVCHLDISGWDPAFQGNKEGNACHFISQNDMLWY